MIPGALLRPLRRPMYSSVLKTVTTYPHPNPYISETAFCHGFQIAYTNPPPPYGTNFWCIGPKREKTVKNCEFDLCWHITDVPERYALLKKKLLPLAQVWGTRKGGLNTPCEADSSWGSR